VNAWMNHIAKVSQIAFSSSSFLRWGWSKCVENLNLICTSLLNFIHK
jgi:hypothetical protein